MLFVSFIIILFILAVLLVIGMFNPKIILFMLSKDKQTRKYLLLILSPLIIIFIIANAYLANTMDDKNVVESVGSSEGVVNEESDVNGVSEDSFETPELLLTTMQEEFDVIGEVEFDNSIGGFIITPTDTDVVDGLELLHGLHPQERSESDINDWNGITDGFTLISETLGSKYDIYLMNPKNEGKALLKVNNGDVIYDAFNEE